ncbi:hypothetical protein M0R45_000463 [Rubus argutus]|uniref:Uncharacterized protein n=1 Tax=Rubus argutus TaxID=59490 RepID=A0AAW1VPZ9_RUBAR
MGIEHGLIVAGTTAVGGRDKESGGFGCLELGSPTILERAGGRGNEEETPAVQLVNDGRERARRRRRGGDKSLFSRD